MVDQSLKRAAAPGGAQPLYIKVPGRGWIAKAGDFVVTSRPEHAKAFAAAEASTVCRKLLEMGCEGAAITSALPDVPDWMKEPDRKGSERRYSIVQEKPGFDSSLRWQGDCWAARMPRILFTQAEAASELLRLCELRPHVKTMSIADEMENNERSKVWARALERELDRNGYRALNEEERGTIEGKRLRFAGASSAQAAIHEAGFLGYECGWPEEAHMSGPTQSAPSEEPDASDGEQVGAVQREVAR